MHEFVSFLSTHEYSVQLLSLTSTDTLHDKRSIFLTEIDAPLFTSLTSEEWQGLKRKILTSKSLLWVTRGSLLDGGKPECGMITGLFSALRTELKSSKMLTVDIETNNTIPLHETFEDLRKLEELAHNHISDEDTEFRARKGLLHVSRLKSDDELNETSQQNRGNFSRLDHVSYQEIKDTPWQLSLEKPASLASIRLEEIQSIVDILDDDSIKVKVQSLRVGKMVGHFSSTQVYHSLQYSSLILSATVPPSIPPAVSVSASSRKLASLLPH